jgi:DNA-directed RNA polymerase subunit RPC12/RpoP
MNNILTDLTCNRCGETFRRKPGQKNHSPCPNCGSSDLLRARENSPGGRGFHP